MLRRLAVSVRVGGTAPLRWQRALCSGVDASTEPPPSWKKLDYRTLEVWDSSRLEELEGVLATETQRLQGVYNIAKEEKRPVIWKNAQFDLKRIEKVAKMIKLVRKDERRTW